MSVSEKKYSFIAVFAQAYSFRILIDYLKAVHEEGYFTFDKKSIRFIKQNKIVKKKSGDEEGGDLVNDVIINTKELIHYEFNEDRPLNIGVDLGNFKDTINSIGKKDGIRLSLVKNDDTFNIQVMENYNTSDSNGRKVVIKKIDQLEDYSNFGPSEYKRDLSEPNFVIPLVDFCKKCKTMSVNCNSIYLNQYQQGLKMEKIGKGTSGDQFSNFGIVDRPKVIPGDRIVLKIGNDDEVSTFINKLQVRAENIKNLVKLNNISSETNMRFFFENDKESAIRLSCNIGCYGSIIIHIQNNTADN
jgi:hypothetical protein